MRVLEREPAHRGAPHVHVEDPAAGARSRPGSRRPGTPPAESGSAAGSAPSVRRYTAMPQPESCSSDWRIIGFSASSSSCRIETGSAETQPKTRHMRRRSYRGEVPRRPPSPSNETGGEMVEPRRIWWARPRKLCALERPGGGGRSHRPERRAAEIEYLKERGVRLVVSVMRTRHNLDAYEAAGLAWLHVPVATSEAGRARGAARPAATRAAGARGGGRARRPPHGASRPRSARRTCTRLAAPTRRRRSRRRRAPASTWMPRRAGSWAWTSGRCRARGRSNCGWVRR